MFTKNKSISFIVPAKDEEKNITSVLEKIKYISKFWKSIFIYVADDGSEDRTYDLAKDFLEKEFSGSFKLVKNNPSKNQGGVLKQFLQDVNTDYIMVLQGQDDSSLENLERIFSSIKDEVDLVVPYQVNWRERPIIRQVLSRLFVKILNVLFCLKLQYYNHSVVMKVKDLKSIQITTTSYAYQAEILIKLLSQNKSYIEVPVVDRFYHKEKTNAFRPQNILGVIKFLCRMLKFKYFSK